GTNRKDPWDLGIEWVEGELKGCGPHLWLSYVLPCHNTEWFREKDPFTEMIRQMPLLAASRDIIRVKLVLGITEDDADFHYADLSPDDRRQGAKDNARSILTNGREGMPLAQAFIGSYDMHWKLLGRNKTSGAQVVEFHLTNASTLASANPDPN